MTETVAAVTDPATTPAFTPPPDDDEADAAAALREGVGVEVGEVDMAAKDDTTIDNVVVCMLEDVGTSDEYTAWSLLKTHLAGPPNMRHA